MTSDEQAALVQQLSEIRKDIRRNRLLLIYLAGAVSILLFAPTLAAVVAGWIAAIVAKLFAVQLFVTVISIVIFFVGAAAVISSFVRPDPSKTKP